MTGVRRVLFRSKCICSDQHLFMKNNVWVEVTELSVGDDVSAV